MALIHDPRFYSEIAAQIFTQTQLLVLFWISYNLMRYEQIGKGTLGALAVSCFVLAALQVLGITSTTYQGRVTSLGVNPNTIAGVLSIGLLALVGLAYGQKNIDIKVRRLAWLSFGVLVAAIIATGSRGAIIALMVGLVAFLLRGRSLATKLKAGLIVLVSISSLVWASYQIEYVRERWERTFAEGDVAGREHIFREAWSLFEEKPLFGWGPIGCWYELSARLGDPKWSKDPHNLYLWILVETGLLGAIPFFSGLWLCVHAAWRTRHGIHGILPLMMIFCLLVINLKGTWLTGKLFWIVLAYALASGSYATLPWQWRQRTLPTNTVLRTS